MSLAPCILSDDELVARIASVAARERTATAEVIALLVELENRKLHLAYGFNSLFGYCRHVLHCSEHGAYDRMEVVRAARRFPVILPMLAHGLLHLTAVRLLAPHLRDEDHLALLCGAVHNSRRDIIRRLAGWFPSPDVAATVRKLPTHARRESATPSPAPSATATGASVGMEAPSPFARADADPPMARPVPTRAAGVAPLSVDRYRLQVTIDGAAHDDLRVLQDLMRREIPSADPAAIVARALKLLRREAERKAFSATSRPRAAREPAPATRDIPAHVERAVWERDRGQCSFEGLARRCEERSFLEYHHLTPWIVGGAPSVENIALRCSAHNKYEAGVYFAPIRAAREARAAPP